MWNVQKTCCSSTVTTAKAHGCASQFYFSLCHCQLVRLCSVLNATCRCMGFVTIEFYFHTTYRWPFRSDSSIFYLHLSQWSQKKTPLQFPSKRGLTRLVASSLVHPRRPPPTQQQPLFGPTVGAPACLLHRDIKHIPKSRPNYGQMRGSSLCLRTKPEVTQLVFKESSHSRG